MSSEKSVNKKEEGDARANAFEKAYKESHPKGPFPAVELKPKPESYAT